MNMKRISLLVTCAALLLTVATYLIEDYPDAPLRLRPIVALLDVIQAPAAFAGIAISGNPHQPNPLALYLVLFLIYWLIVGIVAWLARLALARRTAKPR